MVLFLESPEDVDIVVQRGADLNLTLTFVSGLTGSEMIFTVRKLADPSSPVLISDSETSFTTVTTADDTCAFIKTASEMSVINQGDYYYSVQEKPSGSLLKTRLKGRFTVEAHAGVNV